MKKSSLRCLQYVALDAFSFHEKNCDAQIVVFNIEKGAVVDLDFRGGEEVIKKRYENLEKSPPKTKPGRPKLGVVSKEITLLPRHWDWLNLQPGGASATLRKLIEKERKKNTGKDEVRSSQSVTHSFMSTFSGDYPEYEEALRALYSKNENEFKKIVSSWPNDIKAKVFVISEPVFQS